MILFLAIPIILLASILFLIIWLITKKKVYGKILGYFYLALFCFSVFGSIVSYLTSPKILSKKDYYGHYVIKRDFFRGKQADWQYNHFRFEIKENDSIYFHFTENEKIVKTITGKISTSKPYQSERLIIEMDTIFHILKTNPTVYRKPFSFYLVFNSNKFNNVFFEKGKWKPITQ